MGLALALVGTGGYLSVAGQAPAALPSNQPTFRAGVNVIRLDVIATSRSGTPVADLKAEDFDVTEQGKLQKIDTFKRVSLDGGLMGTGEQTPRPILSDEDEHREAAKDDVRLFGIFLDDYHVRRESGLATRDEIARFVDTQLGPSDMIGVMYPLSPLSSILMTRDHDAVKRGVEEFVGRKYNYEPKNAIEEKYQFESCTTVEQIRNQVSLSALRALIVHMGGLKEGRKALVLVSEGYSSVLPRALRCANAAAAASGNPSAYPAGADAMDVEENRLRSQGVAEMTLRLRDVLDDANRYNVSIYAVDPRRLAAKEFGVDQPAVDTRVDEQFLQDTMETLQTLSGNTDGRAIVNRNDLAGAMKQIVVDTSAYYLLGYNSTFATPDGRFHEINVRVRRRGVELRARKGYWALTRAEAEAVAAPPTPGPPKAFLAALDAAAAATIAHDRVARTWLGTDRGENGRTRVTFIWEPAPGLSGEPGRPSEHPARIVVTAVSPDGGSYFQGRVPEGAAQTAVVGGGRVTFDAMPGDMALRLTVESADGSVLDSEMRRVGVPDLWASRVGLSTPEVFQARTAREVQELEANPDSVPVVGREVARTDRLFIRVAAYGPGARSPNVTAKLLGRGGQAILELPVAVARPSDAHVFVELPLASLPSGDYVVEIVAAGEGGDAKELVAFRIVG